MNDNQFLSNALGYAAQGLYVFPLKPKSKAPLTNNGFKDATIDPKQIRQWWANTPEANIGIATGFISGLWVLDVDGVYPSEFPRLIAASLLTACAGANSNPACVCPPIRQYDREFQSKLAAEIESAPANAAFPVALQDYAALRMQTKSCSSSR